jgi:hypothetical protein
MALQIERGRVLNVGPIDAPVAEKGPNRSDRGEEFTLFDREGANRKIDGRALLQEQQGFEQSERVFAAGYADCNAVAFPDHAESADCLPDFTQN